jgi:CHU_C Type IX secretion signal domain
MKNKSIHITLLFVLMLSTHRLIAQCELLYIKAPDSICIGSSELVLQTSKAREANTQYVWRLPNKDSVVTTDSFLVIKNPKAIHAGKYFVSAKNGACQSNVIGPFSVAILGTPNLADTAKKITICGLNETVISSKFKTSNTIKGKWQGSEGVSILNENSDATILKNLKVGLNTLIWVVSTAACRNFARDTFFVNVEEPPRMESSNVALDARNASVTIPLGTLRGSNIDLITEVEIKKDKDPKNGTITQKDKVLRYTRNGNFSGQDNFSIIVCSKKCKNFCSPPITFQVSVDFDEQYPNVTIPQILSAQQVGGKGFSIEKIENYPKNELKILNRWGAVLEKFENYTKSNPWDGGQLATGAYYYLFQAKEDNNTPPKTNFKAITGIFYIID